MTNFSDRDLKQLFSKGISEDKVLDQIRIFEEGIPFIKLNGPAVAGDGIRKFTKAQKTKLVKVYDSNREHHKLLKFVPASGAASRMFKSLFAFLESFDPEKEDLASYSNRTGDKDIEQFFKDLKSFPFYQSVQERIKKTKGNKDKKFLAFVHEMLDSDKLQFDFYPKGLLPFHNYKGHISTAFEEHLKEGALYGRSNNIARLHFTVSEQHETMFHDHYQEIKERLTRNTNTEYIVNFSQQKPATDTLAVTEQNTPFRENDGSLLFRPGGHGALIENLNDQDADIIFIKNIDNVVVDHHAEEIAFNKEVLAGLLIQIQQKVFEYARMLQTEGLLAEQLTEIHDFLYRELNVRFADTYHSFSIAEQIEILKDKINRPIRICGMVKNQGDPGGGPFWIVDPQGHISLQIIESAQIDKSDPEQSDIFDNSTHFNPVDIICGVRNYRGEKYNLLNFVDHRQGFISEKTKDGKALKALELPGLWNGAMAYWNSIFVEVPLITFNPVKSVNDLLKSQHQPEG
ncbi:MAG: DUF4301 family protein [Flavobacteriaceae bacterium]